MLEYIGWDVSVQMGLLFTCLDNQEKSGFWENEKENNASFCTVFLLLFCFSFFSLVGSEILITVDQISWKCLTINRLF